MAKQVVITENDVTVVIDTVSINSSTGNIGWVRITDVEPQDPALETVTSKVWDDPPGNTVLQSATSSSTLLAVTVECSFPRIEINGAPFILPKVGSIYVDTVDVTLAATGPLLAKATDTDGKGAAEDTCAITIDLPPTVTAAIFTGGYPGAQTELKEDDTFQLQVTADEDFDQVIILDFGAGKAEVIAVSTGPTATVTLTIADRGTTPQLLGARIRVRDATAGGQSATFDTDSAGAVDGVNVVNLNDLRPSGVIGVIDYPGAQQAIKAVENATVNHTAVDFDIIAYTDPTSAQISVANPATFEAAKVVTGLGSGVFNDSATNFRYVMTRNANAAQVTIDGVVVVADVAPTVDITLPAARLRSGGNGASMAQDHSVTLTSSQPLLVAPLLSADAGGSRGTFQGVFVGGPTVWTRDLRVDETIPDEKGAFTFAGLVTTGLAGLVQNTINTGAGYTLGGFVQRTLTFAAFATIASVGTELVDFAKLTAGIFTSTNGAALKQPLATPPPVINGYTASAVGVNPFDIVWLDTLAISANSSGTAQITDVEETV